MTTAMMMQEPQVQAEKQCDNWREDGRGRHATMDACIQACEQNAACAACSIGWDLNDYKEMPTCSTVTSRATYGRTSLWLKPTSSPTVAPTSAPEAAWVDLGAGCCPASEDLFLFNAEVGTMDQCMQKCETFANCGYINYGWDSGASTWCTVMSNAADCSSLDTSETGCGSSGRTGVHAYSFDQAPASSPTVAPTSAPEVVGFGTAVSGAYSCTRTGAACKKHEVCIPASSIQHHTDMEFPELGVTCCNGKGEGSRPSCIKAVGQAAAESHCQAQGLRLCTSAEVKAGAGEATGCKFDHRLVWTADQCEGEV